MLMLKHPHAIMSPGTRTETHTHTHTHGLFHSNNAFYSVQTIFHPLNRELTAFLHVQKT